MEIQVAGQVLLCIVIGYLIGCFSPSYLIGRHRGYDVREAGSGNAGASNTYILAGRSAFFLVAVTDVLKASCSWLLCRLLFPQLQAAKILGGVACVLGHMFPVFLNFRGGKGLACMGGVALAYSPRVFLLMLLIALLIGLATNYVCIVTVSMSMVFPAYYGIVSGFWLGALLLAIPAIPIFIKHIENFRRIAAGQELRLSYVFHKDEEIERIAHQK